jgi:hypothetical protein
MVNSIAEAYSETELAPAGPGEQVNEEQTPIKLADALASLATLRLYEEQQQDGSKEIVRALNRLEREMRGKQAQNSTQGTLEDFLVANQSAQK